MEKYKLSDCSLSQKYSWQRYEYIYSSPAIGLIEHSCLEVTTSLGEGNAGFKTILNRHAFLHTSCCYGCSVYFAPATLNHSASDRTRLLDPNGLI